MPVIANYAIMAKKLLRRFLIKKISWKDSIFFLLIATTPLLRSWFIFNLYLQKKIDNLIKNWYIMVYTGYEQ